MVKTNGLLFEYSPRETSFKFPDISLENGENLVVLGKSGIGKTTLLHLLAGLLRPKDGAIIIDEVPIHSLSNRKLDEFRGKNIGLVFQKNHAIQSLTVLENIKARLFFAKKIISSTVILDLMEQLQIADCQNKRVQELSEGQLQRLGIAMAVVHRPQLILADEPTSSLDDENCKAVIQLLMDQAATNNANLLVITHDQRIKPFFQNSLVL